MAVEVTMGDVSAVLETRGNHGQPEVVHASTPNVVEPSIWPPFSRMSRIIKFGSPVRRAGSR